MKTKFTLLVALLGLIAVSTFAQTITFKDKDDVEFSASTIVYSGDTISLHATGYNAGATVQLRIFDGWNDYYPVYESYVVAEDGSVDTSFTVPEGEYFANATTPMFQLGPNPSWKTKTISDIKAYASGITVSPESETISIGSSLTPTSTPNPSYASSDLTVTWLSTSPEVATVDPNTGLVTGQAIGDTKIIATSTDSGFKDTCLITVSNVTVNASSILLSSQEAEVDTASNITLTATFTPSNTTNKNVTWMSKDENVATVSSSGVVSAHTLGTVKIIATSEDGNFSDTCVVTTTVPAFFSFDSKAKYIDPNTFKTGSEMEVTVNYSMGANRSISPDGIKFFLRQMQVGNVSKDYKVLDNSYAGSKAGTATAKIDLTGAILTEDLPEGGWYWLWVNCNDDQGTLREVKTTWDSNEILIVATTATGLKTIDHRLQVYPNPAEDHITLSGLDGTVRASIFSLDGKQLLSQELGLSRQLNLSQLEQGNYILQIKDDKGFDAQMISIK